MGDKFEDFILQYGLFNNYHALVIKRHNLNDSYMKLKGIHQTFLTDFADLDIKKNMPKVFDDISRKIIDAEFVYKNG